MEKDDLDGCTFKPDMPTRKKGTEPVARSQNEFLSSQQDFLSRKQQRLKDLESEVKQLEGGSKISTSHSARKHVDEKTLIERLTKADPSKKKEYKDQNTTFKPQISKKAEKLKKQGNAFQSLTDDIAKRKAK